MDGFLDYRRYRWATITAFMLLACSVVYIIDNPLGGRNGGTIVGYIFGVIATVGIFYLMWYGIRKRSYHSKTGPLIGWLSAHVWLGLGLLFLVPLHSGFSWNFNIHTLAYVLLCMVVSTGIWGAVAYATMAPEIKSHRGGPQTKQLLEQIDAVTSDIAKLTHTSSEHLQLLSADLCPPINLKLFGLLFTRLPELPDAAATAKQISHFTTEDQTTALSLAAMARRRQVLVIQLVRETRVLTGLRLWLLLHLPLSFALVAAVIAHIGIIAWYGWPL